MGHRRQTVEEPEGRQAPDALPCEVREELEHAIGIFHDRVARNQERREEFRQDAREEEIPTDLVEITLEDRSIFLAVIRDGMEQDPENAQEFIQTAATLERLARVPDPDRK